MSDNKLTLREWILGLGALTVIVTLYTVISQFVLNQFWSLVFKLFGKITKK